MGLVMGVAGIRTGRTAVAAVGRRLADTTTTGANVLVTTTTMAVVTVAMTIEGDDAMTAVRGVRRVGAITEPTMQAEGGRRRVARRLRPLRRPARPRPAAAVPLPLPMRMVRLR